MAVPDRMDAVSQRLAVQVCYAPPPPSIPIILALYVSPGTTIGQVLIQPDVVRQLADWDSTQCRVGIWGKLKPLETVLRDFDRIEIYRALIADPKDARRNRAAKNR